MLRGRGPFRKAWGRRDARAESASAAILENAMGHGMSEQGDATLAHLERLIAFPTVSSQSNLALIDHVESVLKKAGFATHRLPSPEGTKAGLAARIGPGGPGGVMLSAHSDVVPTEGQDWIRPPFQLTHEGSRLYGRGTTDMKGFLAAMLSVAERAGAARLTAPLMLVISYDEEVGCIGIAEMLPGLEALGWRPDLCIVGEPTGMRVATGHKGKLAMRAICHGKAGHSSLAPHYVNALHLATDLIGALRDMQADYAQKGARDDVYDLPYSTTHAGKLQGGTALNIVADRAVLEFELRHLPADTRDDFGARLEAEIAGITKGYGPGAAITLEQIFAYPGLEIAPDHAAVTRARDLSGGAALTKVAFGTEAGFFDGLGIPTIVCGPGDMAGQGHQPDEYVEAAQMAACDDMMDRILAQLRAGRAS